MKRLKDCYYLIVLLMAGVIYLSAGEGWKVYARALEQAKDFWLRDSGQGMAAAPEVGRNGNCSPKDEEPKGEDPGEDGESGTPSEPSVRDGEEGDGGAGEQTESYAEKREQEDPRTEGEAGEEAFPEPGKPQEPSKPEGPVFGTVEDDYFSDAVFIGDSRTVGMYEYGGLEDTAAFYASSGLTVYKLFDAAIVSAPGQKKKITVEEALQENSFAKIYLMIGINEMGTGTVETFTEKYRETVQRLRELQPDAVIYIQGIIKVTTERSNQGDYINNEGIEARNEELAKLADNRDIFYLDVNPLICDETGGLIDSYTFDGVHLKAKYITIWKDYLKENAVINLHGAS